MGIIQKIAGVALTPSTIAGNAISNLIKKGSGTTKASDLAKTGAGKVLGTAIALTGAGLAGAAIAPEAIVSAGAASAGKAATKIVTTGGANLLNVATKNPLATVGTGIFVAGGGLSLIKPAVNVVRGATDTLTGTPTASGVVDVALLTGAGLLAAGGVGAGLNAYSNYQNRQATNANTAAMLETLGSAEAMQESGVQTQEMQDLEEKQAIPVTNSSPQPQGQKINQSVKLYVNSQNKSSKRYLNIIAH